jgi:sodium/bile acid cotransporter 7
MVFVGAVGCGEKLASTTDSSLFSLSNVLLLVAIVTGVHIALLVVGAWLCRLLKIDRADAIPVAFGGSQKTLMVGAYLANSVGPLAIVPMVAYHAAQLVVDTLVADWLTRSQTSIETTTVLAESAQPVSGGSVPDS